MSTMFRNSLKALSLSLLVAGTQGCVSSQPPPRPLDLPFSRVFVANYDEVWNATVSVLDNYSIISASRESGELKTEYRDEWYNKNLYKDPEKEDRLDVVRYQMVIRLSKGLVSQTGRSAVRVQVLKQIEKKGNLVQGWQRIPSDTIEENVILYRIGQRLRIMRAIQRERAKKQGS
jgi:hypothetical protein